MTRRARLALLAAFAACAPAGGEPDGGVSIRDSAGIRIVEVRLETAELNRRWGMRAVPELTAGAGEGGAGIELYRVAGARRLGDGRLLIADGGNHRLLLVDPRTGASRGFGRKGRGPGEFEVMGSVWRGLGDTVYVYDVSLARVTPFTTAGVFGSPLPVPAATADGMLTLAGRFTDGTYLGFTTKSYGIRTPAGVQSDSVTIVRVGPGAAVRTLARLPFARSWVYHEGGSMMVMAVPFDARGISAAWGDGYLLGDAGRYELRHYGLDGRLERVIRRRVTPAAVTRADVDRVIAAQIAAGTDAALVHRIFSGMPIPRHFPVIGRVVATADGGLWVQDGPGGNEDAPVAWTAFGRDGAVAGRVTLPGGARVVDVSGDHVAAIVTDEDEVERVIVYRLEPIPR